MNSHTGFWVLCYPGVSTYYLVNIYCTVAIGDFSRHRLCSRKNELFTVTLESLLQIRRKLSYLWLRAYIIWGEVTSDLWAVTCLKFVQRVAAFVGHHQCKDGCLGVWWCFCLQVIHDSVSNPIGWPRWFSTVSLVCCRSLSEWVQVSSCIPGIVSPAQGYILSFVNDLFWLVLLSTTKVEVLCNELLLFHIE